MATISRNQWQKPFISKGKALSFRTIAGKAVPMPPGMRSWLASHPKAGDDILLRSSAPLAHRKQALSGKWSKLTADLFLKTQTATPDILWICKLILASQLRLAIWLKWKSTKAVGI